MLKLLSDYETCFKCEKVFHTKKKNLILNCLNWMQLLLFIPTSDCILLIYFGVSLTVFGNDIYETNVYVNKSFSTL